LFKYVSGLTLDKIDVLNHDNQQPLSPNMLT